MSGRWTFPWEELASQGAPAPDGLSLSDRSVYRELRALYREVFAGHLTREQAGREKRLLRREWEKAKEAEAFAAKQAAYHVRLRRRVEQSLSACRKNPSRENALRLCDAIDGLERPMEDLGGGAV